MRSRRDFLRITAILAGALPASRGFAGIESAPATPSSLRSRLAVRRSTIKTLRVDFEYETEKPALLAGRNWMFFSNGLYHLRHGDGRQTILQIVQLDRVLNAVIRDGIVQKASVRARTQRDPGASLETFLPQPEDKPMTSRGYREIGGERCLGILQGERCYWVSEALSASRAVELYATAERVKETIVFDDFLQLSSEVAFPRLVRITSFDEGLQPASEKSLKVSSVALNTPLPDELFEIDAFPGQGERTSFS